MAKSKKKKRSRIRPLALCVIRHGDAILVSEGHDPVKQQTFYRPPGGGIEFGETGQQTVVRELMEEMDEAVTDLRKLLRVKVEDDQDLVTAQQALSEAGSVRMKLNGKAKVFWYNQELVPELSAAEKAKLASEKAKAALAAVAEHAATTERVKEAETKLRELSGEIEKFRADVAEMEVSSATNTADVVAIEGEWASARRHLKDLEQSVWKSMVMIREEAGVGTPSSDAGAATPATPATSDAARDKSDR